MMSQSLLRDHFWAGMQPFLHEAVWLGCMAGATGCREFHLHFEAAGDKGGTPRLANEAPRVYEAY